MSKALPLMLFLPLFGVVSNMAAQSTHTFTFGTFATTGEYSTISGCAEFQTIDGEPANQATGNGEVCVPYAENPWWGLEAPQSWGFPNNGFLTNNVTTPALSAPTFTTQGCNLKTAGCIDYQSGTATFIGYGAGVTVEVTIWSVVNKHTHFGRGCYPCISYTNDETNGSGTATYQ